jgi:hypothetical protein
MPRLRPAPADSSVVFEDWKPRTWELTGLAALLLGLIAGIAIALTMERGSLAGHRYHLWRWEADTLTANMFARLGIGPDPGPEAGDEAIQNYFRLTSQLRAALESEPIDIREVDRLVSERSVYENDVERYVEGLLSDAIEDLGLKRGFPLFNDAAVLWPPVDFELTTPPQLLVRSPRDRIERAGDTLLKPGLSFAEIEAIEEGIDDDDTVSLVVSIGGLAAYPAIVTADRSFDGLLDTAAHEWVHHYLAFYPLGEQWGKGGDAETLNETTASIAGSRLAQIIRETHPIELAIGEDGRVPPRPGNAQPQITVDFNTEMRALRLEVDDLLAHGRVQDAERVMEERRLYLEQGGHYIRKLNQAYFAFYGTYATGPASSNPVGPKIERVWELTQDVGLFLKVMREVTSVADLDRALAQLEGSP